MRSVYFDLPEEFSQAVKSKYGIIPVPFDKTTTYGKGSDKGPQAILEASRYVELYDIETDSTAYTQGIYMFEDTVEVSDSASMIESTNKAVTKILERNQFPIVLGGEHSVAIGSAQAVLAQYSNCTVLQLDAHSDLREEFEGSPYNHACAMARIREFGTLTQVGIRSMDESEKPSVDSTRFFPAETIMRTPDWISKVVNTLSDNVYITLDLDVFDPSIMPSTGTPEPGGLNWYQVLALIKQVCKEKNLVGCDINELAPTELSAPNFLAAKLLYKIITYHDFYR